jgi:hypothetical protein
MIVSLTRRWNSSSPPKSDRWADTTCPTRTCVADTHEASQTPATPCRFHAYLDNRPGLGA